MTRIMHFHQRFGLVYALIAVMTVPCNVISQFTTVPTTVKPHRELQFELEVHGIIPDCLSEAPPFGIHIKFLEKVVSDYGNILKPDKIKFAPYLIKYPVKNESYYTVMMVGLDEPSRQDPAKREWLYYLVCNVPGPTVFQGEIIARWIQPLPDMDTGMHRYVFLIYEQRQRTAILERRLGDIRSDKDRAGFSHKRFAEKYKFGKPLAVNFFQCMGPFNPAVPTFPEDKIPEPTDNYLAQAEEEERRREEAKMGITKKMDAKKKKKKDDEDEEEDEDDSDEKPEPFSLSPPHS